MQAVVFDGVGRISTTAVADATLEAPGDALVRTDAAGLCGSDLHVYRGHELGLDAGTTMGHELAGTIVAVGDEVRRFAVGDRVVAPFSTACGDCFYCRLGLPARCERGQLFGWVSGGRGLGGCQAELVRVPLADATLVAMPDELGAELALLAGDVLATGWFGAASADVRPGTTVAVLGCGAVGLSAVAAAFELGAATVVAVDPAVDRRELAQRFGAAGATPETALDAVRALTRGRGADCVVEAVGSPAATRLAVELARPGATLAAVGVHYEAALAVPPGTLYDKNLTYRAGRCPARAYLERALLLLAAARFPFESLVSHHLPLAAAAEAYAAFDRRESGWTKVLFLPNTPVDRRAVDR